MRTGSLAIFSILTAATLTATILTATRASAQAEEIYSRSVRIFHPRGDLPRMLIRLNPPTGNAWKRVEGEGLRLSAPSDAQVDLTPVESRILQVKLGGSKLNPPPVLRVDRFVPGADDPTDVDAEYADEFAVEYPKSGFNGKFTVSDSGMLTLERKTNLAMVGGTYAMGATETFRIYCSYLSKDQQLFVTFDCAAREWPRYSEQVGQMLLSLQIERKKAK